MPRPTRGVRQAQRDATYAKKPCRNGCGHPEADHLELAPTDPQYKPLHFHCRADCNCVLIQPA
jgi:hypothetical protein